MPNKCSVCGLEYWPLWKSSLAQHRQYHDEFLYGVRLKKTTSDEVIAAWGDLELLLVTPNSQGVQMKPAERVAQAELPSHVRRPRF